MSDMSVISGRKGRSGPSGGSGPSELTASYLVGRADRIIRARLEEALVGTGLSLPEFTALSVLASRPGLSNARLARRSLVTPQAMHKVMRSLEDAGLVARTTPPTGGRTLEAVITESGAKMLEDVLPRVQAAEDRTLLALDASERREFIRLLTLASSTALT
jgi:DNA-binding MarR family transcriptional regulator